MAAPKSTIEFLPKENWEKTTAGKILKWALSVGRYIVILTELVVILAFLSRFKFDRELTDLHEDIKQKQTVVEASQDFEQEFRLLQKRLLALNDLGKKRLQSTQVLTDLTDCLPIDTYLADLNISKENVSLAATALSANGLATLINQLQQSILFENIALTNVGVEAEKTVGIKFEVKINLAQKP